MFYELPPWIVSKRLVFKICPFLRGSTVRNWFPTLIEPIFSLAIRFLPILISFVSLKQILQILPLPSICVAPGLLISDFVFYFLEKIEVMKVHTAVAQPLLPSPILLFSSNLRGRNFLCLIQEYPLSFLLTVILKPYFQPISMLNSFLLMVAHTRPRNH